MGTAQCYQQEKGIRCVVKYSYGAYCWVYVSPLNHCRPSVSLCLPSLLYITPSLPDITPSLSSITTSLPWLLHCLRLITVLHHSVLLLCHCLPSLHCNPPSPRHNNSHIAINHHSLTSHHSTCRPSSCPCLALLATNLRTCLVSWPSCRQRG